MDPYRKFILEAKIGEAKGFSVPRARTKKPTKEEVAIWRSRSDKFRKDYLNKHPNSKYKNVPERGSIITRSKKISSRASAQAMTQTAAGWLRGMGMKNKGFKHEHVLEAYKNIKKFLNSKDRSTFISNAKDKFNSLVGKLSHSQKSELDQEVKSVQSKPGAWASDLLERKNHKGILPGLIGVAAGAAMFGLMATGVLPPEVFAFLGIKILDSAVESIRHMAGEGFTALLAGKAISDFFESKDSDEYAEDVHNKLKKQVGDENEDSDNKDEEKATEEPAKEDAVKENIVEKPAPKVDTTKDLNKLGIKLDPDKYMQDENGNWVRKKKEGG